MKRYRFNKEGLFYERVRMRFGSVVYTVLKYFLISLLLAAIYYVVYALFFNNDRERELMRENQLMREQYEAMLPDLERLENVVEGLEAEDEKIYSSIFNADPPASGYEGSYMMLEGLDTLSEDYLVYYAASGLARSEVRAFYTSDRLEGAFRMLSEDTLSVLSSVPSHFPLENFAVTQTGASVGKKINPFYKVVTDHSGIDLLTFAGDKVLATAPGVVKKVERLKKGLGSYVVIDHGNGYETTYAHLGEINVRRGKRVKRGEQIGVVGVTGLTFAPHLHYEVRKDGEVVDPVHYFFGEASPEEYLEMIRISSGTGQSLD